MAVAFVGLRFGLSVEWCSRNEKPVRVPPLRFCFGANTKGHCDVIFRNGPKSKRGDDDDISQSLTTFASADQRPRR